MKRYLILPGYVESRRDGQKHWVGVLDLIDLYGVRADECIVAGRGPFNYGVHPAGLIQLRPRYDGDYRLPTSRVREPFCRKLIYSVAR